MFDRDGFKKYVGTNSGSSYVNGLDNIEKFYRVDIDAELQKDKCVHLLTCIDSDKKKMTGNDRHNRQNWFSHLKKYIEYKVKQPAEEQKLRFISWMKKQPQRDDPTKLYSDTVVNAAASKLQSGLKTLGVSEYQDINCFTITDVNVFEKLYQACYEAATVSDREMGYKAFRNGLDFYKQFLAETSSNAVAKKYTVSASVVDKIRLVISHYKRNFETVNKQERYKWEAIGWYKQHWNIEAENFAEMLANAFGKASNLLASGRYFPYRMITEYANANPEEVRRIFRILYDESIPLAERYQIFQNSCKSRVDQIMKENPDREKSLNHYQDLRAVVVYLTFEYPEKYFLFKSTMYSDFCERVAFVEDKPKVKSAVWKVEGYHKLCELILAEVKNDSELIAMSKARLDDSCYKDPALHLLTMDLVYYGSNYMSAEDFDQSALDSPDPVYWPSLEEYNPGITKDMWVSVLYDGDVTTPENLDMLKKILELGGESTCAHLAEVYGNTHAYYNKLGSSFGEKVKKHYSCPDCIDHEADTVERNRVYVIPFVGRYVTENGNKRYSWKLREELKEALMSIEIPDSIEDTTTDVGLNTVLYGPPGTGKTYHTVIYAVAIIENKELATVEKEDYAEVLDRYNEYKAQGQIEFTTFHQSYGYEEFIEGIRPGVMDENDETESGNVQYSVQPGIFKKFCEKADCPISVHARAEDLGISENATIWKVSLWSTGDNEVRTECLQNNHIRIGWDQYGKDITDKTDFSVDGGSVVLNAFINKMQVGDIVFSCYSASTIDAIGIVTGEYEWHDEYEELKRVRKVNWLVKGIRENILALNGGKSMTLASVYRLSNIAMSDVFKIVNKYQPIASGLEAHKDNYVFIIDEINRGNISKIFGELITLVEESKRVGKEEGVKTLLPYSMKPFGVPENVYIIGTMNTADRSIATIDTALRRRFEFKEMLPNPNVVAKISVGNLSIKTMLEKMNRRIAVLYDREHTIGHAYFMPLAKDNSMEKLAEIFKNKIIPLLQEYFFEDYEKIRLVLADNQKRDEQDQFILAKKIDQSELFGSADIGLDDGFTYEINQEAFMNPEAYQQI